MTDRQGFANSIRAFCVLYPIPIIFTAMLLFLLCCLAGAAMVTGPLVWVLAAIGVVTELTAILLVGYVIVRRSDLLRVERVVVTERIIRRL
jgi:hypothetical protein